MAVRPSAIVLMITWNEERGERLLFQPIQRILLRGRILHSGPVGFPHAAKATADDYIIVFVQCFLFRKRCGIETMHKTIGEKHPMLLASMDGTPIYDVKPYLPYAEAIPGARGGFADAHSRDALAVDFPPELLALIPEEKRPALLQALSLDPRPAYQDDPERVYGFWFAGRNIRFRVDGGQLTVVSV